MVRAIADLNPGAIPKVMTRMIAVVMEATVEASIPALTGSKRSSVLLNGVNVGPCRFVM